jgi:hypothetical protein
MIRPEVLCHESSSLLTDRMHNKIKRAIDIPRSAMVMYSYTLSITLDILYQS